MASCQRPAVRVPFPVSSCHAYVCAYCMYAQCISALVCIHACVCVCVPSELRCCVCAELLFPDGTGKQTLQGWQCWHGNPVHSWHCQPPGSPLWTEARVPAASRLSSSTDWQAVDQGTYSLVQVSLPLF